MDLRLRYPIESARLILEPFQEADADALYKMESDAVVKQYAGGVLTHAQTEKLLKQFVESVRDTGLGALAIKVKETNQIVGLCGLYLTDTPGEAEIFYGLARDSWGEGYATEACEALIAAATQQLSLSAIIAGVHPENLRSVRVLERLGLRFSHFSTDSELYEVAHVYRLEVIQGDYGYDK